MPEKKSSLLNIFSPVSPPIKEKGKKEKYEEARIKGQPSGNIPPFSLKNPMIKEGLSFEKAVFVTHTKEVNFEEFLKSRCK